MLEKTLESPLDSKEIKPVNLKGNQPWIVIGRTDAEAEASILWPSDAKSGFIGKYRDAGKDWRQEETGATEDKMVGWLHLLSEHEFEQTLGDGEGQGNLVCCSPSDHRDSYMTERLNSNKMVTTAFLWWNHLRSDYSNSNHAFWGCVCVGISCRCNILVGGCPHMCACLCVCVNHNQAS